MIPENQNFQPRWNYLAKEKVRLRQKKVGKEEREKCRVCQVKCVSFQ